MKKLFFLALAGLSITLQTLVADCCSNDYCGNDCFGFDSVLTFDVGGGYRNDTLKWKTFPSSNPGNVIEEKWNDISLGVVEANAQFLACEHYLLKADFDYGWFTNSGTQRFTSIGGFGAPSNLRSKPRGNVYDIEAGIGYQFNFDCYRVSLAPLVGYSYHQQRFKSRKFFNELNPLALDVLAHNDYKFRWSGPWVGFAIAYQATCELQVYLDYSFHWTRFRGTVKENFLLGEFPNHLRSNRAYGNEVIVGSTYTFCDYWFVGLKFDYKEFFGHKGNSRNEIDLVHSALRNLEWTSYTVTLDIGYTF